MAATRELVISELLCFILNKFGRVAEEKIKLLVSDFYSAEEINEGKTLLNKHLVELNLEGLPRLKKRMGDNRSAKDLDDIFYMINRADEKLALNELPGFVAQNLERVPHLRPEDLDLVILTKKVTSIEDRLKVLTTAGTMVTVGGDKQVSTSASECQIGTYPDVSVAPKKQKPTLRLLSEVVASSPGDEVETAGVAGSEEPFITVTRKRLTSKKRAIVGSFTASGSKLSAARPVLQKSIFHVDNAAEGCQPSDIIDHLKSLNIPIVSCFDCKSWRKKGPAEINSAAFRLCVEKEQANKILNKETWPRGIMVRPWKFKTVDAQKSPVHMEESMKTNKSEANGECNVEQPSCNNLMVDVGVKTDLTKNGS
jgi:hypothetical protein